MINRESTFATIVAQHCTEECEGFPKCPLCVAPIKPAKLNRKKFAAMFRADLKMEKASE